MAEDTTTTPAAATGSDGSTVSGPEVAAAGVVVVSSAMGPVDTVPSRHGQALRSGGSVPFVPLSP
ncbi:hypothetical protein HX744_32395 [Pseudonocardia sp. ICBG1122]|nr:hypothetical protein [Pseudonocardia pini]